MDLVSYATHSARILLTGN